MLSLHHIPTLLTWSSSRMLVWFVGPTHQFCETQDRLRPLSWGIGPHSLTLTLLLLSSFAFLMLPYGPNPGDKGLCCSWGFPTPGPGLGNWHRCPLWVKPHFLPGSKPTHNGTAQQSCISKVEVRHGTYICLNLALGGSQAMSTKDQTTSIHLLHPPSESTDTQGLEP